MKRSRRERAERMGRWVERAGRRNGEWEVNEVFFRGFYSLSFCSVSLGSYLCIPKSKLISPVEILFKSTYYEAVDLRTFILHLPL